MNTLEELPKPAADPLLAEIKRLAEQFDEDDRGLYVRLVDLGLNDPHAGEPEAFYGRLLRGGLRKERASEIRAILENKDVARKFISVPEDGQRKLGIKAALRMARAGGTTEKGGQKAAGQKPDQYLRELAKTLDRLVLLMEKSHTYSVAGDDFLFQYTPTPVLAS